MRREDKTSLTIPEDGYDKHAYFGGILIWEKVDTEGSLVGHLNRAAKSLARTLEVSPTNFNAVILHPALDRPSLQGSPQSGYTLAVPAADALPAPPGYPKAARTLLDLSETIFYSSVTSFLQHWEPPFSDIHIPLTSPLI